MNTQCKASGIFVLLVALNLQISIPAYCDTANTIAANNKAAALAKQGNLKEAMTVIKAAIQKEPNSISLHKRLAGVYALLHDYDNTIAESTKAIDLGSKEPNTFFLRGAALARQAHYVGNSQGNYLERAIKDFNVYTNAKPADLNNSVYFLRAMCYLENDSYEQCIPDFTKAIALNSNQAEAYTFRASAYMKLNDYAKAKEDCKKAIIADPKYADAYFMQGKLKIDTDDLSGAIQDLSEAIRLEPKNGNFCITRAACYLDMGDNEKALSDLNQVVKSSPQNGRAYYYRSLCHSRMHNTTQANADLAKSKSLGYKRD
jgi:tetratricopeptide (TPR) repeat protein